MAKREPFPHDDLVEEMARTFRDVQRTLAAQIQSAIAQGRLEFAADVDLDVLILNAADIIGSHVRRPARCIYSYVVGNPNHQPLQIVRETDLQRSDNERKVCVRLKVQNEVRETRPSPLRDALLGSRQHRRTASRYRRRAQRPVDASCVARRMSAAVVSRVCSSNAPARRSPSSRRSV